MPNAGNDAVLTEAERAVLSSAFHCNECSAEHLEPVVQFIERIIASRLSRPIPPGTTEDER